MSTGLFEPSIWDRQGDNRAHGPKYCPHCGDKLAHPDNLRDNDAVDAWGRQAAYRRHREAHFSWGTDPAECFECGDPYLAKYYGGVETDDAGPVLDEDEEVAGIYDVEINYEAVARARVVAADKGQARKRADEIIEAEEDLTGRIPIREITHELHSSTREVEQLTRGEIQDTADIDEDEDDGFNLAERLPGWPW